MPPHAPSWLNQQEKKHGRRNTPPSRDGRYSMLDAARVPKTENADVGGAVGRRERRDYLGRMDVPVEETRES